MTTNRLHQALGLTELEADLYCKLILDNAQPLAIVQQLDIPIWITCKKIDAKVNILYRELANRLKYTSQRTALLKQLPLSCPDPIDWSYLNGKPHELYTLDHMLRYYNINTPHEWYIIHPRFIDSMELPTFHQCVENPELLAITADVEKMYDILRIMSPSV